MPSRSPRTSCEGRALPVGVERVAHALRRSLHDPVCSSMRRQIASTTLGSAARRRGFDVKTPPLMPKAEQVRRPVLIHCGPQS